jgi:dienelactone hydrolase
MPSGLKRRLLFVSISLLVLVALFFFWLDPYLDAASVLLRVSNPNGDGILTRHDTNRIDTQYTIIQTPAGPVRGRLYIPVGVKDPPAIVVLHGVHHLGIEEPRLINFSRALSTHGILVLTPEMADLADYHVEPTAIAVIGSSARDLKARTGADSVAVLGLSFAGGLALVAAADPRYENDISVVASIGGHDSLPRVLRFYATNSIERPDGSKLLMPAHEYGVLVVAYSHPQEFFPAEDVELARDALRQQLYEIVAQAQAIAARLSPAGRNRMELLLAHKTDSLSADLLRGLAHHEAEAESVSPAGKLAHIKADVFLAHGAGDNVIPPTELLWIEREVAADKLKVAIISPAISHVELGGEPTFADRWQLVHFMEEFLRDTRLRARSHHALAPSTQQYSVPQTPGTQPWSH